MQRHAVRFFSSLSTVLVAAIVSACATNSDADQPVGLCTAPRSIAIEVDVIDSLTGQGVAVGATGSIRLGGETDSLWHVSGSTTLLAGGERRGTYDVVVNRPRYATWVASGVHVTRLGNCGNVIPEHLTARLQASPR
ncbi:MAG: hypothetical protein ABI877_05855 [Gemmatimonadaceae bacterium]